MREQSEFSLMEVIQEEYMDIAQDNVAQVNNAKETNKRHNVHNTIRRRDEKKFSYRFRNEAFGKCKSLLNKFRRNDNKKHNERLRKLAEQRYTRKPAINNALANRLKYKRIKRMAEQVILDLSALKMGA